MTNEKLRSHVTDEVYWDPKFDNAAIAASADSTTTSSSSAKPPACGAGD